MAPGEPGPYPARAGRPWLCRTFVLFLFHVVVVPSGLTARVQPHRWMTIWWWKGQSKTQSFADVFAAVDLVRGVVYLAGAGGLGAAAGPLAVPVPQQHRRDRLGVPDIQRQARPAQPHPQLPPPQEAGQPPGPETRSTALPITACPAAAQAASRAPSRRRASSSTHRGGHLEAAAAARLVVPPHGASKPSPIPCRSKCDVVVYGLGRVWKIGHPISVRHNESSRVSEGPTR